MRNSVHPTGPLAAHLAHELNTPLGAILVAVELALTCIRDNPERARLRLDKAMQAIEQMQTVLSGLSQVAWEQA
jgi:signal transduction histidine kinase